MTEKHTWVLSPNYQKGANIPDGNTEFQFMAGDLNFDSSSYDWLDVSGGTKSIFKDTGTINGRQLRIHAPQRLGDRYQDQYNSRYIPDQDWDKVCSTIVYDNLVGGSDAADSSIRFFRKYHRPQIPNFFKNS